MNKRNAQNITHQKKSSEVLQKSWYSQYIVVSQMTFQNLRKISAIKQNS